jgi:hypothetical protein
LIYNAGPKDNCSKIFPSHMPDTMLMGCRILIQIHWTNLNALTNILFPMPDPKAIVEKYLSLHTPDPNIIKCSILT